MDILIGIGLFIWGSGLFIWQQFFSDGLTSQSILQIVVAIVGCLIILAPRALNFFMNFELPDTEKEDDIKLDDQVDYEDFKALNYLKDRARQIGSEEAFDLIVKLNTLIFSGELDEK
jgi:hypothetical protein|tara:strand:- start:1140 stop:1490 length:351 start_codon:yes stop_codon:yes gene_type:complete